MATTTTKRNGTRPNPDEFTTVRGAAEITHTSEPTIRRKLTRRELKRYKFSGRTLIRVSELLALVREA
jgi:hypothetical protein